MLIEDEAILDHIRSSYKGYSDYCFKDEPVSEEREFVVVQEIHQVNEALINLEKDLYVRGLQAGRQTNCGNIRMLCDSLDMESPDLGEAVYKELEKYNPTYTKAYLNNGSRWVELGAFFAACGKAKALLGNRNPRLFFNISKFSWMLSQNVLNSANVKLDYVRTRSLYELMFIEARKSNYDVVIQPVTTYQKEAGKSVEYETLLMSRYFSNFSLHTEMKFDHEFHVFGVTAGLAARRSGNFARIRPYYYQFRLHDLLTHEYGYLNWDVEVAGGPAQPILVNKKPVAHRVLLRRIKVKGDFSSLSRVSAKLLLGRGHRLPEARYIYDYNNPVELASLPAAEVEGLLLSGEGMLVYQVYETLYDSLSIYDNINSLSNTVIEKGEFFDAKYNLFGVSYRPTRPALGSLLGYVQHLFPVWRARQHHQLQMAKLFDSMVNQQKNAILQAQQAESALNELRRSNEQIRKISLELQKEKDSLEQKVLERTRQLERIHEQKTNTFVNIAHEVKTPLTLINNYLDEYIDKYGQTEEMHIVKSNIDKLNTDIVNYFDLEKFSKGFAVYDHNQVSNFSRILKSSLLLFEPYGRKGQIAFYDEIEDDLLVKAHPGAVHRIINNLVENAIRYSPEGGRIEISLRSIENKVSFSVKDTGIGIPPKLHSKIFTPYFQINTQKKNYQGMGLGLSIVKTITDSLNGSVTVESDPQTGPGTRISVQLDLYSGAGDEAVEDYKVHPLTAYGSETPGAKDTLLREDRYTVMVVEDNWAMLSYLSGKLGDQYNVLVAGSGAEALRKIKTIRVPDLIISDVMMDQMDGLQLAKILSAEGRYNHVPILFLTAKASRKDKREGLQLAIDYIHKPFSIDDLKQKIHSVLTTMDRQRKAVLNIALSTAARTLTQRTEAESNSQLALSRFEEKCNFYKLTPTERKVAQLVSQGKTNKEIADMLSVSEKTVDKHVQHIFEKTAVSNRVELTLKLVA